MKKRKNKFDAGFTIIEMMIALGIVIVLMSVVLYDYASYNDKQALSSVTQEIALAIRQAQNYSLNVKESNVGSGKFDFAYGINFSSNANNNGDNTIYTNFVDNSPEDQDYDKGGGVCGSANSECTSEVELRNGVIIEQICGIDDSNNQYCPPQNGANLPYLSVSFLRPNLDAMIKFTKSNAVGANSAVGFKQAIIKLKSPRGGHSSVTIEKTGQIYVQ